MSDRCNSEIFSKGHSVATLDACRHRAEDWVQQASRLSGQPMDWHYSGGIANILYLGDYEKVAGAVQHLSTSLEQPMARLEHECGSCSGEVHRPGHLLRFFGAGSHGPYRAGDPLPDGTIGVVTH